MKNKFEQRSFDASLFLFAGIIIIPDCRKYTVIVNEKNFFRSPVPICTE